MVATSPRVSAAAIVLRPSTMLLASGVTAGRHALGSGKEHTPVGSAVAEAHQGGDAPPPLGSASVEQLVRRQREELREVLSQRDLLEDPPRLLGPALLPDLVADLGADRGHLLVEHSAHALARELP